MDPDPNFYFDGSKLKKLGQILAVSELLIRITKNHMDPIQSGSVTQDLRGFLNLSHTKL